MAQILIADSDEDIARSWGRALRSCGHSCTIVHSGYETRILLEASTYDLLIAEALMPKGSGVLLAILREALFPNVKVLLVASDVNFAQWLDDDHTTEGAEKVLSKPIDINALFSVVSDLLKDQEYDPVLPLLRSYH